jgi:hypothetical protein
VTGRPLTRLFRHPRRLGFIAFNLLMAVLLALWSTAAPVGPEPAILDLPNLVIGYVGGTFLLAIWAGAWLAWTLMVLNRRRRLRQALSAGPQPRFG